TGERKIAVRAELKSARDRTRLLECVCEKRLRLAHIFNAPHARLSTRVVRTCEAIHRFLREYAMSCIACLETQRQGEITDLEIVNGFFARKEKLLSRLGQQQRVS